MIRFISITLMAFLFLKTSAAQDVVVDNKPGIGELTIGAKIAPLVESLGLKEVMNEELGEPTYVFKDLKNSKYSTFEDKIDVQELLLFEEGGIIYEVRLIFPSEVTLSAASSAFSDYFGVRMFCAVDVENEAKGGCILDGSKVSFSLDNQDWELLTARFYQPY